MAATVDGDWGPLPAPCALRPVRCALREPPAAPPRPPAPPPETLHLQLGFLLGPADGLLAAEWIASARHGTAPHRTAHPGLVGCLVRAAECSLRTTHPLTNPHPQTRFIPNPPPARSGYRAVRGAAPRYRRQQARRGSASEPALARVRNCARPALLTGNDPSGSPAASALSLYACRNPSACEMPPLKVLTCRTSASLAPAEGE